MKSKVVKNIWEKPTGIYNVSGRLTENVIDLRLNRFVRPTLNKIVWPRHSEKIEITRLSRFFSLALRSFFLTKLLEDMPRERNRCLLRITRITSRRPVIYWNLSEHHGVCWWQDRLLFCVSVPRAENSKASLNARAWKFHAPRGKNSARWMWNLVNWIVESAPCDGWARSFRQFLSYFSFPSCLFLGIFSLVLNRYPHCFSFGWKLVTTDNICY